ncbi:MAG: hypothetical protein ACRC2T_12220 [Thermoguttaceae bacterium]
MSAILEVFPLSRFHESSVNALTREVNKYAFECGYIGKKESVPCNVRSGPIVWIADFGKSTVHITENEEAADSLDCDCVIVPCGQQRLPLISRIARQIVHAVYESDST